MDMILGEIDSTELKGIWERKHFMYKNTHIT